MGVAVRCSLRKSCLCARFASVLLGLCALVLVDPQLQYLEVQVIVYYCDDAIEISGRMHPNSWNFPNDKVFSRYVRWEIFGKSGSVRQLSGLSDAELFHS